MHAKVALKASQVGEAVQGIILIETDDLFNGGTEEHHRRVKWLSQKYKFGRWQSIRCPGGGELG